MVDDGEKMSYTVDEKLIHNKKKNTSFSSGYVFGVTMYRKYDRDTRAARETTRITINEFSVKAKQGNEMAKGFMCGVRDAANERKARKGK